MTIEERMNRLEQSLGSQDALVRELRDAVTVTAALEARQGQVLADHREWLVGHDRAMTEMRESAQAQAKAHRRAMADLDKRIAELTSGIGRLIPRDYKDEGKRDV